MSRSHTFDVACWNLKFGISLALSACTTAGGSGGTDGGGMMGTDETSVGSAETGASETGTGSADGGGTLCEWSYGQAYCPAGYHCDGFDNTEPGDCVAHDDIPRCDQANLLAIPVPVGGTLHVQHGVTGDRVLVASGADVYEIGSAGQLTLLTSVPDGEVMGAVLVDVVADGEPDLVMSVGAAAVPGDTGLWIGAANGTGFDAPAQIVADRPLGRLIVADMDGDGVDEMMVFNLANFDLSLGAAELVELQKPWNPTINGTGVGWYLHGVASAPADLDGDAKADALVWDGPGAEGVAGAGAIVSYDGSGLIATPFNCHGGGLTGSVFVPGNGAGTLVMASSSRSPTLQSWSVPDMQDRRVVGMPRNLSAGAMTSGDAEGDGKADVALAGLELVWIRDFSTITECYAWLAIDAKVDQVEAVDFDGDGANEFVALAADQGWIVTVE